MKNSIYCLTAILLSTQPGLSQGDQKLKGQLADWYFGTIVMASGDVLETKFSYIPLAVEGLLQFSYKGTNYTAGPSKISSFGFYDEEKGVYRKFQSFPIYNEITDFSNEMFMEIIYESAFISLVGRKTADPRLSYMLKSVDNKNQFKGVGGYESYLIDMHTRKLYGMSKKDLLKITNDQKEEVKDFIKNEHLRLVDSDDFISVIEYYATLK